MNNQKYVGCFDILGFKSIVETAELEWVVEIFELVTKKIFSSSQYSLAWGREPSIKYRIFSDTVFFWTEDMSEDSFFELVIFSSHLIGSCLNTGICLRGALAKGELHASDEILVGKAIIKAYQMEQLQQWAGCWVDPELVSDEMLKKEVERCTPKYLMKYDIPTKNGVVKDQYVINWSSISLASSLFQNNSMEESVNQAFHWVSDYTDKSVEEKKKNTLDYLVTARKEWLKSAKKS